MVLLEGLCSAVASIGSLLPLCFLAQFDGRLGLDTVLGNEFARDGPTCPRRTFRRVAESVFEGATDGCAAHQRLADDALANDKAVDDGDDGDGRVAYVDDERRWLAGREAAGKEKRGRRRTRFFGQVAALAPTRRDATTYELKTVWLAR